MERVVVVATRHLLDFEDDQRADVERTDPANCEQSGQADTGGGAGRQVVGVDEDADPERV